MKAQSDLAGDRKRRAEMTRPRVSGVTKRIDDTVGKLDAYVDTCTNIFKPYLDTTGKLTGYLTTLDYDYKKVIYRPAGR